MVSCIQVCHLKSREFSFLLWMLHSPPITSFLISSPKYQWRVRIIRILVMQFYPVSFYFLSHRSKYSVHRPVFKHPSSILSSKEKDQVSYLYETTGKITWERGSYGSEYEDNSFRMWLREIWYKFTDDSDGNYFSSLMEEAAGFSETLIYFYHIARLHVTESG